ncbi:serine hydrolase [Luteimonas salinisoli]|nr:serine hydrolase [Luteimonas salinisoli]
MKYRIATAALIGVMAISSLYGCADAAPPPAATALDEAVPGILRRARVPAVAVARIEDGKLAWTRVYGEASPGIDADGRTVFNVASLTKPVFGMLTLQLAANGRIDLDADLSPFWVDPDIAEDPRRHALTPRLALSHQTGFPNWRGRGDLQFAFAPGARHEYSGEGYEYLRRALEGATGQSMEALIEEAVLAPAGMDDSSFGWDERWEGRLATGFDEAGKPLDMAHARAREANAAANMFSTVGDYSRFVAWVVAGAGLPRELFADMQRPQAVHAAPVESFGLGWKLVRADGAATLWHDGREPGVRSFVLARPASRDGLVILSNGSNGELAMRPIIEAAVPGGAAWLRERDMEVWRYLQSVSGAQLEQLLQMVSGSPSFMAMLMHAADAALLQRSPLDSRDRAEASAAIEPFALGMVNGTVTAERAVRLTALLLDPAGEQDRRLVSAFDQERARAWLEALRVDDGTAAAAAGGAADSDLRTTVEVPDRVLREYVGEYRVPSASLLISIAASEGRLIATAEGTPATTFHPASQTRFFMKEAATDFEFVRGEEGQVSGIRIIWDASRSEFAPRVR